MKHALLVLGFLLTTAHRCPAPIQEVPETPTPAATVTPTVVPAKQSVATPTPIVAPSTVGPVLFAGSWNGKIKFGKGGEVDFTLVVNAKATSLKQTSRKFGELTHPTTLSGDTLSWNAGHLNEAQWTLVPTADGRTAVVTLKLRNGEAITAIFQHRQSPQPAEAPVQKRRGIRAKPPSGY